MYYIFTVLILCFIFAIFLIILLRLLYQRTTVFESIPDKVVLKILVPLNNDKGPASAEQMFQSIHGILKETKKSKFHFSFEIVANFTGIYFIVVCNKRYKKFIENQIYAQYPNAQISEVQDYATFQDSRVTVGSEIVQVKNFYLPIKTFMNFQVDPLASITSAISKLDKGNEAWIQILLRPVNNKWQNQGKGYVNHMKNRTNMEGQKVGLQSGENTELSEIEKKNNKVGFQFIIRTIVRSPDAASAQIILEDIEASFKQFQTGQLNSLVKKKNKFKLGAFLKLILLGKRRSEKMSIPMKYQLRTLDEFQNNILNVEELASLYHLPYESVKTPNISWAMSKKLEFPIDLPKTDARIFAMTDYRNIHIPFGIKENDRKRHMYLLGKTGTGKSTLIKTMIVGDILDNKGVAVIDPHGDLVDEIINLIPPHRINDVIYLDPSDTEFPIGLNMLDLKEGESKELLADGIVSVFKKYFDSWGPRLQYILTNCVVTLLNCQNVSLLAVQRILVDKNYRKFLLKQVKDPFIRKFWEEEFNEMSNNPKLLTEAIAPIQNKVGRFLSSPMVRNLFGQVKSSFNLSDVMNSGKILLVNLSQGKIGEENSSLLGGMIVTRLYSNAMQRALIPESQRKDFYLYVDEFQNFATDTFVKILSEARKYSLNLIVTHQYIDQLSPEIQNAIFGNVGSLMNFTVGQSDAAKLAKEYQPYLEPEDLVNLARYRLALKLMIDGAQSKPFTALSINPKFNHFNLRNDIVNFSRETYAKPKGEVEEKLNKWANQKYDDRGNLIQQKASGAEPHKK